MLAALGGDDALVLHVALVADEDDLGGYEDPRVSKYFDPATDDSLYGDHPDFPYKGIRNGAELVAKEGSSRLSPVPVFGSDFFMEVDAVIVAVGQRIDRKSMADLPQLGRDILKGQVKGRIVVDVNA